MMHLIILLVLFTGLAWFISWSMIAILFYPKKPILGWQAPLIGWVKDFELNTLIKEEQLTGQLDKLIPTLDHKLEDFFRNRLAEKLPMISMFIGDKTIQQLKIVFMDELRNIFPELIHSFSSNMQKEFIDQLEHQSLEKLKFASFSSNFSIKKICLDYGFNMGNSRLFDFELF
jgi:hypothetical protein